MKHEQFGIDALLQHKVEQLNTELGLKLGHPVSQGDLSETEWARFLRSFLPNRYEVSKGFVFDSAGGVSEQIDLIVFDPFHSPLIHETGNGEKYVTAESVYAVFEVKQKADNSNIRYADKKIRSVCSLKRTSRAMVSSGKIVPPRKPTKIIGGLLTADSIKPQSLKHHLRTSSYIDIVCAATKGTFLKGENGITCSSEEEAIFSFFYILLDELHKQGTVAAVDIRDYADRSLSSFKLERGDV
jgi:hypothetical protein